MHLHLNIVQSLKYMCTTENASMVCRDPQMNLVCAVNQVNVSASGDLHKLTRRLRHIPGLV